MGLLENGRKISVAEVLSIGVGESSLLHRKPEETFGKAVGRPVKLPQTAGRIGIHDGLINRLPLVQFQPLHPNRVESRLR